jgi:AcrR family transcriptional regulator
LPVWRGVNTLSLVAARDRIVEAASELFVSRGFTGTTVADVQTAAGLTAGSGALYKHFSSKEDLFAACVERAIADNAAHIASGEELVRGDLRATLRAMAIAGLARLRAQRPLMRMLFHDGERFPALRDRFRDEGVQPMYAAFAAWIKGEQAQGRIGPDVDRRAAAAVLIGSVVAYEFTENLVGEPPAKVSEKRFIDTWVAAAARLLEIRPDA